MGRKNREINNMSKFINSGQTYKAAVLQADQKTVIEQVRDILIHEDVYRMLRRKEKIEMLMEKVRPRTWLREQLRAIDNINEYNINHIESLRTWSGMTNQIAELTGLSRSTVYNLL